MSAIKHRLEALVPNFNRNVTITLKGSKQVSLGNTSVLSYSQMTDWLPEKIQLQEEEWILERDKDKENWSYRQYPYCQES